MIPLARNILKNPLFKQIFIVFIAIVVSISAGVGVFVYMKKDVVINDNGKMYAVKTMKNTVGEVMEQYGIRTEAYDYVSLPPEKKLQRMKLNRIDIKRAVPVNVSVDGRQVKIMTYKDTIRETLDDSSIKLSTSDKLQDLSINDKIVKGMDIQVVRVNEKIVTEDTKIPFKVVRKENSRMDQGVQKTLREGKEGIQEKLYRVVFENGKQVVKELIKDSVKAAPINRIVEYGTLLTHATARGGVIRYKKVLDMRATAYTASYGDTGKSPGQPGFGVTYTGTRVKKGIIAVDPGVIPLGTRVYIEVAGSTPDYGYAVAADIGSAIKGNIIDVYLNTQSEANQWGSKRVKVYILDE